MVAAVVLALVAVGGTIVGVQVRASAAAAERDRTAQQAAAEASAAELAAAQAAAARDARDAAARSAWGDAAALAGVELDAARVLLAGTEGQVADDTERQALTVAIASTQAALDAGSDPPEQDEIASVTTATATLHDAAATLTSAHEDWLAARAAASARPTTPTARATPTQNTARTTGAGPDCSGPDSYEPPTAGPGLYISVPTVDGDGTNGNMPRSAMSALSWCADSNGNQQWLRADAAAALTKLNAAFRAQFGENIGIDLSYRSYADQVRARELFGSLAAKPGTSNHGWGTAIDVWEWKAYGFGSDRYTWLVAHGPDYGWVCPAATRPGNPEYWHYEYVG
jgi:LAS superfamily LD-carboxypeptidase LdcB